MEDKGSEVVPRYLRNCVLSLENKATDVSTGTIKRIESWRRTRQERRTFWNEGEGTDRSCMSRRPELDLQSTQKIHEGGGDTTVPGYITVGNTI